MDPFRYHNYVLSLPFSPSLLLSLSLSPPLSSSLHHSLYHSTIHIDCITVSTLPVKSSIDDQIQQLFDALLNSLRHSIAQHLQVRICPLIITFPTTHVGCMYLFFLSQTLCPSLSPCSQSMSS